MSLRHRTMRLSAGGQVRSASGQGRNKDRMEIKFVGQELRHRDFNSLGKIFLARTLP